MIHCPSCLKYNNNNQCMKDTPNPILVIWWCSGPVAWLAIQTESVQDYYYWHYAASTCTTK